MKSEDTVNIIKQIALEEGISEWAVTFIVKSQFEGANVIIKSAVPDHPETFKGVRLNALCYFKVMKNAFRKFKGREAYLLEKKKRYDDKKLH
jgi:hypothetical protein